MKPKEFFEHPDNAQPGLLDKYVHGAIPSAQSGDNWDDFIDFMSPYFEQYAQQKNILNNE